MPRFVLVLALVVLAQSVSFAGGEGLTEQQSERHLQILKDRATVADDANFLWESLEEDMADFNTITAEQFERYLDHLRTLWNYSDDPAWLARAYQANTESCDHTLP